MTQEVRFKMTPLSLVLFLETGVINLYFLKTHTFMAFESIDLIDYFQSIVERNRFYLMLHA